MATLENTDFNIEINKLVAYPERNGYTNLVFMVLWKIKATYIDEFEFTSEGDFSTNINTSNIEIFVPFDQLTKDEVVSWIDSNGGLGEIKQSLVNSINNQRMPVIPPLIILDPPF
jgi:hypothetical protein